MRKSQLDAIETGESGGEMKRAPPDLEPNSCLMGEAPIPVEWGVPISWVPLDPDISQGPREIR